MVQQPSNKQNIYIYVHRYPPLPLYPHFSARSEIHVSVLNWHEEEGDTDEASYSVGCRITATRRVINLPTSLSLSHPHIISTQQIMGFTFLPAISSLFLSIQALSYHMGSV
ncbi:hypothetical protein, unlikely [Trypanosoma brucei gambiense DAL972]|uniref:Uncharacterized protein n=1 Tax=Trypanosoma brucei gambiense (strain MHOM/CI/86/DAL972) TaxID=679716 RepID=D0A8C9_TRYB9|nr:hypothetical protein, unlikely [Trypanosoma brucei gambiense DAL972]CBH17930.1 hypothetical protein, unlikely [Trypanosoma brucei gambiense DAL972]|eukprot:XP_011780194.1 hypothetical protein, unlikely [Trypanosoma brucei gambiense DAL972]